MDEIQPWDRQTGETSAAWKAFVAYRDMGAAGAKRSIDAAYRAFKGAQPSGKRAPGFWMAYAANYCWVTRAAAYDAHLEQQARKEREAAQLEKIQKLRDKMLTDADELIDLGRRERESANGSLDRNKPYEAAQSTRAAVIAAEAGHSMAMQALGVGYLADRLLDEDGPSN